MKWTIDTCNSMSTWTNLKRIMPSEKNPYKKSIHYMILVSKMVVNVPYIFYIKILNTYNTRC